MLEFLAFDIIIISFLLEFLDIYAGMGFGMITPVLILLGYPPLEIIPPVLLLSCLFGLSAAFFHHWFENVSFRDPLILKIVGTTILLGFFGIVVGVGMAVFMPVKLLELYIAVLIVLLGVVVILRRAPIRFSWSRLGFVSLVAGFNKGMSGGGYGPILTSGQILSGILNKQSVSITALAEGVVSLVGFSTYLLLSTVQINWTLAISMLIGGGFAVLPATYVVKISHVYHLKMVIGLTSIILGMAMLIQKLV
ncbi:sulfite exporter TauE/SafE family protein [Legionella yabuuchiae]|uniref:sulfite exporter TauE/SafE family protein n=1 Tax=Legionella yabuuchiae TaxID=376727 RepID=UPI00105474EE|nr:sulfite exporter TauE/SafE family protein [Legionella yabuuchiae]